MTAGRWQDDALTSRSFPASPAPPDRPRSAGSSSPSTSRKANARSGFGPSLGRKRAERLADFAAVVRTMHGDQRVERVIAERGGELELLLRRRDRILDAGRAEMRHELLRQRVDRGEAVVVARLDDLHQRRPAERGDAEKARAERRARLAFERRRIVVGEHEGAGHRPFAGLRRLLEHERVGGVEPDGAEELHAGPYFGPRVVGIVARTAWQAPQQAAAVRYRACPRAAPGDRRCRRCRAARPFPARAATDSSSRSP